MTTEWVPGQRKRERSLQKPIAGLPDHLRAPVLAWIDEELHSLASRSLLAVELQWSGVSSYWLEHPGGPWASFEVSSQAAKLGQGDVALILDVVEWCLEHGDQADVTYVTISSAGEQERRRGTKLNSLLTRGNSAYRVRADGIGLEHHTSDEAVRQFEQTVTNAGELAAKHLSNAWNEAYSLSPDPVKSCSESVKAIEAAYDQLVSPQNKLQTLGTMIRDIRQAPQKWVFALDDHSSKDGIPMVAAMMDQIWKNQQRHATGPNVRSETLAEAQCAVHLSGTLVHLASSGAFAKTSRIHE